MEQAPREESAVAPTIQAPGPSVADTPTVIRGDTPGDAPGEERKRIGPYILLEELGHGGMGVVYRARHANLGTPCAIKLLISGEHASEEAIARFQREAASVARMGKHPHIVHVFDLGREGGIGYYAMELVEGRSLSRRLHEGEIPFDESVAMVEKIARAVHFAHEHGVIHRDLKPDNIVVRFDGEPQVMDFGLARDLSSGTRLSLTGDVMGTPAYMAPEQARGDVAETDARTDVYALGGVLYEMLTGMPPHPGNSLGAILERILVGDILAPRRLRPDVPRDVETICLKCLSLEPERRYVSAASFADDLARWRRGEPIQARRVTWAERAWKRVRRHAVASAIAACLAMAALVAAGAWWRSTTEAATRGREKAEAETRARAEAERRRQVIAAMCARASEAVYEFEDAVMMHPMSPAVRDVLARQPLRVLEELVRQDDRFGPAYAWRAKVTELLQDESLADSDYERACTLSPESAVVWYLRGMSRLERYARSRGLAGVAMQATKLQIKEVRDETHKERDLREGGLEDLGRMARCDGDALIGDRERRIGLGLAAIYRGTSEAWEEALSLLSGVDGPKADRLTGLARLYRMELVAAEEAVTRALALWPEDGESWRVRALIRFVIAERECALGKDPRERYRQAIADFQRLVEHDPRSTQSWVSLAYAKTRLAATEADTGVDVRASFQAAISDCNSALDLEPEHAGAYETRASARMYMSRYGVLFGADPREGYRLAIADFGESLRRHPDSVKALLSRGCTWRLLGTAEQGRGGDPRPAIRCAIEDFDSALRLDPASPGTHVQRGAAWKDLGVYDASRGLDPRESLARAIRDLDEAVQRDPEFIAGYNSRGEMWRIQGDAELRRGGDAKECYGRSLADYGRVLERALDYSQAYYGRALTWVQLSLAELAVGQDPRGSLRKAIADMGECLKRNPQVGEVINQRGIAWLRMAEAEVRAGADPTAAYASSEADFTLAIEKHEPRAALNLGIVFRATRRYDQAVASFEAGGRALPELAAMVEREVAKTRELQKAAADSGTAVPEERRDGPRR